jgi:hypothetical protein
MSPARTSAANTPKWYRVLYSDPVGGKFEVVQATSPEQAAWTVAIGQDGNTSAQLVDVQPAKAAEGS